MQYIVLYWTYPRGDIHNYLMSYFHPKPFSIVEGSKYLCLLFSLDQGCGSGSGLDPDSMGCLDPDLDPGARKR
jgi:hypothetical protein